MNPFHPDGIPLGPNYDQPGVNGFNPPNNFALPGFLSDQNPAPSLNPSLIPNFDSNINQNLNSNINSNMNSNMSPNFDIYNYLPPQQEGVGYPPPDPSLYEFYPPPDMGYNNQPQIFHFTRRINRMNWDLIGNIDVLKIARTGDRASVEMLTQPLAFANITKEDAEQFGTRASLHAFQLLQMATELLLAKLNSIPAPGYQSNNSQSETDKLAISNYAAKCELLAKDIQTRDALISKLTAKVKKAEEERDEAIAKLQSYKQKSSQKISPNPDYSIFTPNSSEKPIKLTRNPKSMNTVNKETIIPEPGYVNDESQYIEYEKAKQEKPPSPKKKKKARLFT